MSKLIITVGAVGSGKSTFARNLIKEDNSFIEVNRGDIRKSLFNVNGWSDYKFSEDKEVIVTRTQYERLKQAFDDNQNVVLSNNSLNITYVEELIKFCEFHGVEVKIKIMNITLEEIISRTAKWDFKVDYDNVNRQYKQFKRIRSIILKKYRRYLYNKNH